MTVTWTRMEEGTKDDYEELTRLYSEHSEGSLVPNLCTIMRMLEGPKLGYQIDRYQHSLQSATRALRNEESIDLVVAAVLHDIGDAFAPMNHSETAAALLEPYVDERTHWVVKHHGVFQGYHYFHHLGGDRDTRERYEDSPHYDACVGFSAEYDQNCFDPRYDTMAIEEFIPMMNEVFSRTPKYGDLG